MRLPEFGSEKDFPLIQAINKLKGQPVMASKTQTVRKTETETEDQEKPQVSVPNEATKTKQPASRP